MIRARILAVALAFPALVPVLPAAAEPAVAATKPAPAKTYVVRPGDTLTAIAKRFGVTVAALAAANRLKNPDRVLAGQRLVIPAPATVVRPPSSSPPGAPPTAPGSTSTPASTPSGATPTVAAPTTTPPGPSPVGTTARGGTPTVATVATIVPPMNGATATTLAPPIATDPDSGAPVSLPPLAPPDPLTPLGPVNLPADVLARIPAKLAGSPDRLMLWPLFDKWAAANALPASLLRALSWMESGWQQSVVSPAGAIGLGQLIPQTADFVARYLIGQALDPHIAEHNLRMSARYLRHLLDLTGGDVPLALAGYYQGLRSVQARGMFADTVSYVNNVLALQAKF